MGDYILSCGSTADLTQEQMKKRDIHYVCFHFILDGQDFADDMGQSISPGELYEKMTAGADVKTSQVPVAEYLQYFESLLKEGKDILHVEFSSGLSGSWNSACLAAGELAQNYPERKIYVVDSLGASSGYGLIMETLADLRDAGKSIEELHQWIEENKLRMHHWFFSTDLSFYIKGGRITKTAGMVGTLLNICPMLENPEKLRKIVAETGAHSTDMQSPESAEHLCAKCDAYAENWVGTADRLWECSCKRKGEKKQ